MRTSLWMGALLALAACGGEGGGEESGPVSVSQDITSATTWEPTSADCDVVVKGVVGVKAALTVKAGTKVCFDALAALRVDATGSLNATGTASERITFTSQNTTKGSWRGVAFLSVNNENKLLYTDISYAGSSETLCCGFFLGNENAQASVLVGDYSAPAQVTIQNSTITQSGGHGLFVFPRGKLEAFSSNRFAQNELTPVSLFFQQVTQLDTATVYGGAGSANGQQWVRVLDSDGDITTHVTFRKLDVPYGMALGWAKTVFNVSADLTVEAGVRMDFEANSGILIEQGGRLNAAGTAGNRITFTGRSQTKGFWKGLAFLSIGNVLAYTDVSYGGNDEPFCCGFFEPAPSSQDAKANLVVGDYSTSGGLTLDNVTSTQSGNRGVAVLKGTVNTSGSSDLVSGNLTVNLGL